MAPQWLSSDRTRRIVSIVCFFRVELFIIVNLAVSSSNPSSALCWTQLTRGDAGYYIGLIDVRYCFLDDLCYTSSLKSEQDAHTIRRLYQLSCV